MCFRGFLCVCCDCGLSLFACVSLGVLAFILVVFFFALVLCSLSFLFGFFFLFCFFGSRGLLSVFFVLLVWFFVICPGFVGLSGAVFI